MKQLETIIFRYETGKVKHLTYVKASCLNHPEISEIKSLMMYEKWMFGINVLNGFLSTTFLCHVTYYLWKSKRLQDSTGSKKKVMYYLYFKSTKELGYVYDFIYLFIYLFGATLSNIIFQNY